MSVPTHAVQAPYGVLAIKPHPSPPSHIDGFKTLIWLFESFWTEAVGVPAMWSERNRHPVGGMNAVMLPPSELP
jgi:hypothetical protein